MALDFFFSCRIPFTVKIEKYEINLGKMLSVQWAASRNATNKVSNKITKALVLMHDLHIGLYSHNPSQIPVYKIGFKNIFLIDILR